MNLSEILKKATQGDSVYNTVLATVKAVDEAARTCDVLPIDGSAEIFGVRLNALLEVEGDDKGEYNIPAVNSFVLVTLLDSANAFISRFSIIDKKIGTIGKMVYSLSKDNGIDIKVDANKAIVKISNTGRIDIKSSDNVYFNDGNNGGVIRHSTLINYLNEVVTYLGGVKTWLNSHIHPAATPNTATPVAPFTNDPPSPPNMENTKVRH
jgi:hypothetical protein